MILIFSLACLNNQYSNDTEIDTISLYDQQQASTLTNNDSFSLLMDEECTSPCTFASRGSEKIKRVEYFADGYYLGSSQDHIGNFSISYEFQEYGTRQVEAIAYDENNGIHGRVGSDILVRERPFVELMTGTTCTNPCTFKTNTSENIYRVEYIVDGWSIGSTEDFWGYFPITYSFQQTESRELTIIGYGKEGQELTTQELNIDIEDGSPYTSIPYFYQYSNSIHPSSTCQNTSIAMLLSHFGWNGVPDDITRDWGKNYAQSPAGLADVFNTLANENGISQRLEPVTNGTLNQLKTELEMDRPVIVHGYFTGYGHVVVVLGYDEQGYWVNDPAGEWTESFQGGYPYGWNSDVGRAIYYQKHAFEKAIATWDGYTPAPLWFHKIR